MKCSISLNMAMGVRRSPIRQVSVQQFASVLDELATASTEHSNARDDGEANWIRNGIAGAGIKLHALNYMLHHAQRYQAPRLLDVGSQVGSLAVLAARVGFTTKAIDLSYYADRYGSVLGQEGVTYLSCDLARESLPFSTDSFDFVTYLDLIRVERSRSRNDRRRGGSSSGSPRCSGSSIG